MNSVPANNQALLNCQQAAQYLGVSLKTVRRWAQKGKLKGKKVGSRGDWRFTHEQLNHVVKPDNDIAALREREERYRTLFDSLEEGFCIIEILYDEQGHAYDHRFIEVNSVYENITRMKNPVGKTLREIEPNISPEWTATYARVAETGKPHRSTQYSKSRECWYDISATRIGGPGSRIVAALFTDVTEKRRMEEDRVRAMEKVISTLESIDEAFFQVDEHWNVEMVNERFVEMTNLSREQIVGRNISMTFPDTNRHNTLYYKTLMQVMKTRQPAQFVDYYAARKRWIEVRAYPTESGLSAFVKDITRQKTAEENQIILNQVSLERDELIRIGKAKDEFIGIASHQLRTPATAVKQYIGLLLNGIGGPLGSDQRRFLETAYASNERQLKLINDLLKTAQIDSDTYELSRSPHDVISLLRNTVAALEPIFDQRKQNVVTEGLDKEIVATVDPIEMDLVFSNLLENASKYSHDGGTITVRVQSTRQSIKLSISDEGVGIAKEDQRKIFDKFTRIANELSDETIGSGLGLYWVRHIVELHDGDITVTSRAGKGSTFTVTLPR